MRMTWRQGRRRRPRKPDETLLISGLRARTWTDKRAGPQRMIRFSRRPGALARVPPARRDAQSKQNDEQAARGGRFRLGRYGRPPKARLSAEPARPPHRIRNTDP